jgi:hypothetical protein
MGVSNRSPDFYNTFWSLQLPFSKPTIFAGKATFEEFKEAVNKVIPLIKEATAKERAMMGSRSSAGVAATLKRKREPEEETNSNEYFFAKFLTNPDLLDLEVMLDNEFFWEACYSYLVRSPIPISAANSFSNSLFCFTISLALQRPPRQHGPLLVTDRSKWNSLLKTRKPNGCKKL